MTNARSDKVGKWRDSPYWRIAMMALGWLLILASPIIGALPGPGFIIVFPIGLAMILKNSRTAKKLYSRFAKTHPEYGLWMDWVLRRTKAKQTPPFPPVRRDIMAYFRRDDEGQDLP